MIDVVHKLLHRAPSPAFVRHLVSMMPPGRSTCHKVTNYRHFTRRIAAQPFPIATDEATIPHRRRRPSWPRIWERNMASLKVRPLRDDLPFGSRISGVTWDSLKDEGVRKQMADLFEERGVIVVDDCEPTSKFQVEVSKVF